MEIIVAKVIKSLITSFYMLWEVFWPLILGFLLSALIQTQVSKKSIAKLLGGQSPKDISIAALFGATSSSCSYAAVAMAKSIFKKGASFTSAMVFEIASTNLVIELGIILFVLLGWQFMFAQYLGGIIMVMIISIIFRITLTKKLVASAKRELDKGLIGKMEGHAQMNMSTVAGSWSEKIFSRKSITFVSHYFVMDWLSIWQDLFLGFLIAGALATFIPHNFWQNIFLSQNPTLAKIEGPLIGPLVAVVSFVCSVGNIPLAAVLWNGGISFGGVVSFIFADLIVLPIMDIYRKYYGLKVMFYIFAVFYLAMALSGYIVEIIFSFLHIIPQERNAQIISGHITLNYTTFLNIIFAIFAFGLVTIFLKTRGLSMLKMMNMQPENHSHHHN